MQTGPGISVPLVDDARRHVSIPSRFGVAILGAAIGLAAVALLEPLLSRPYYFPAFAAIVLAAVVAGARYAALTTLLFGLGYVYWFLAPRGAFAIKNGGEVTALIGYTVTGWFVAIVGGTIRRLYARLRDQHRLLDRTVGQREDLLHALTHDIRSPLSVITMNADLLARSAGQGDATAIQRRAALIKASAGSIDSMLRDLVKVVALESGQVVLELADVDLRAVLDHLKESLAGSLPTDRLVSSVAGDLPPVRADPRRLERVLVNLVSNALKYSSGPVTISASLRGADAVVSVRDEGSGIPPDDLPHVFEKFFRAAGSQSKEGLGLGLYISRLLVEAHGGRIWAESAPGKGSTFHVSLPLASALARSRLEAGLVTRTS